MPEVCPWPGPVVSRGRRASRCQSQTLTDASRKPKQWTNHGKKRRRRRKRRKRNRRRRKRSRRKKDKETGDEEHASSG